MFLMLDRKGLATSPKITTEFAIKAMDCCDEIYLDDEMNSKKYYYRV